MKPFSWSFSKLKNVETCPRRHYEVDILKNFQESGEALLYGNQVHEILAKVLQGTQELPEDIKDCQKWVDVLKNGPGELLVEQKYALTKDFQPTEWFSNRAWYRGIADAVRIDGPVALAVDWKTGKLKIDSVQLMLMAQCVFAHHKDVQKIRTEFIWLQEDCSTREDFTREDVANAWIGLLPRVEEYERRLKDTRFEPKPGYLCQKFCPVTTCEHHGRRR